MLEYPLLYLLLSVTTGHPSSPAPDLSSLPPLSTKKRHGISALRHRTKH
jgi:hypothetical protein